MKNKICFPIFLIATALILASCSKSFLSSVVPSENSNYESSIIPSGEIDVDSSSLMSSTPHYLKKDVVVEMDPMLKETTPKSPYKITFSYDDEYFLRDAKQYDADLSMLSFGASIVVTHESRGQSVYRDLEFNDIVSHDYDKTPTKESVGYFMAHKAIGDYELVVVSFRGFEYQMEWANNFVIGKTGNHEGFNARGVETYLHLQFYLGKYVEDKPLKIWISGYSRGGALSNVLASLILKEDKIKVSQENMFVYTFEAPASLNEENALPYENVHNINNEADLITYIPPEKYGLKRCGVDYPIYDPNTSSLIKEFDSEITVPEFKEVDSGDGLLTNDTQVKDYILGLIFDKEEQDYLKKDIYANTREQYVDNYQTGLSNMIGYVFALKEETRASLITDLQGLGLSALTIIADESGAELMKFFKAYLDRDEIEYNEDTLQEDCAILTKGIQQLFLKILLLYLNEETKDSLVRLIDMHYPETTYVLLKNAHQNILNK